MPLHDDVRESTESRREALWTLLRLAIIGATAAGVLQLAGHLAGRYALGRAWSFNPRMIWLAPAANLALFIPLLALVSLGVRLLNRRESRAADAVRSTQVGAMAALAIVAPLLLLRPRLHLVAILILAAGVGVLVRRWNSNHLRVIRQRLTLATVVALLLLVGGEGFVRLRERERGAVALANGAADQPNVLFLVLDTVRALSMSAYGYNRPTTPNLARLAREGVRFDRAIATAPWTLASHATLFTGMYPNETSVSWTVPLDARLPVLAERFAARGYVTGGFAANLTYCTPSFGLARGFQFYQDYLVSSGEAFHSSMLTRVIDEMWHHWRGNEPLHGRPLARDVADRFLAWEQRGARHGHPYFAFLNFFDAHAPYVPPAPYDTMFLGRQARFRDPGRIEGSKDANDARELQSAYDQSLTYLDSEVGRLLSMLRARGTLDNTVVVVVSDHGEEFLENGTLEHGDDLYFPSLHVPLLIRYPKRIPAGTVVSAPVSLRDVAATVLDLARAPSQLAIGNGQVATPGDALPGETLVRLWTPTVAAPPNESPLFSTVPFAPNLPPSRPVSKGGMRSLVRDGMHLIVRGDGREELFDIMRDPFEQKDVADDNPQPPALQALRHELSALDTKLPPP